MKFFKNWNMVTMQLGGLYAFRHRYKKYQGNLLGMYQNGEVLWLKTDKGFSFFIPRRQIIKRIYEN